MVEEGKDSDQYFSTESMPEVHAAFPRTEVAIYVGVFVFLALFLIGRENYLLFHTLAELFSIAIACGIFMIAWNSRRFMNNNFFLFLGIAYAFVSGLDAFHTMAYEGVGILQVTGANLATQLWIAARYLESLSLLAAAAGIGRRLRARQLFLGFALVFLLLLGVVFYTDLFPTCFVEGVGLTPFKKISEYIISAVLLITIIVLMGKREDFDRGVLRLLIASIVFTICSELSFTSYITVYGFSNFVGHYFKIIAFYLLYKAIVETGLAKPYSILFRDLKQREEAIRASENRYRALSESLEETVQQKIAELRQSESLAAVGRMVSTVAHEVRNPLQNIKFGVDTLRREIEEDAEKMEILEEIDYGVNTLNRIVRDLLDYARPVKLQQCEIPIGKIVDRALKGMAHDLQRFSYTVDLEDGDRDISVDPVKSTAVLVNLITNAVEAMPTGGTLTIASRFEHENGAETLHLSITDNGCGISEENLPRIYEPFFTTKVNGTGLGIPTCRKIVEAHGGRLNITSKIDHGTTVEIILPTKDSS